MSSERRKRRSKRPTEALNLWLSSAAERTAVQALVLSDLSGLSLGSSLGRDDADEVAAILPIVERKTKEAPRSSRGTYSTPYTFGMPYTMRINVDTLPLLLGAVGDTRSCANSVLLAEGGVRRILLAG